VPTSNYIRWFSEIRLDDVGLVGGKNASLGQMYAVLSTKGILVPNGFALTAAAYRDALTAAKAWEPLHRLLGKFDKRRVDLLAKRAAEAHSIVYHATGIEELRQQTIRACAPRQLPSPLCLGRFDFQLSDRGRRRGGRPRSEHLGRL
jgi:pyruvate, water dikinase